MEADIWLPLSNEPLGGSEDRSSTYSTLGKENRNICTVCIKVFDRFGALYVTLISWFL